MGSDTIEPHSFIVDDSSNKWRYHRTDLTLIEQFSIEYRTLPIARKNAPCEISPGYIQLEGKSVTSKKCGTAFPS
jgi:hypothetical protein